MSASALVTGSTGGLGEAVSSLLARAGWHVLLACRDPERGRRVQAQLQQRVPGASADVVSLDLASLDSVRTAASAVTGGGRPPLRLIICNAGIQIVRGVSRSHDGHELTFATNHLGHYLLTRLLHDAMPGHGRMVFVSSGTHLGPRHSFGFPGPRWEDPSVLADAGHAEDDRSARGGRVRYATSKLANVYTAYEWARRCPAASVTVNAFDPGLMPQTGLSRQYPAPVRRAYVAAAPALALLPGIQLVPQAAAALAWVATAPELRDTTGAYFAGVRRRRSSAESYDQDRARRLWEVSAELVGLSP